jgi:hypothetical protein
METEENVFQTDQDKENEKKVRITMQCFLACEEHAPKPPIDVYITDNSQPCIYCLFTQKPIIKFNI